MTIGTSISSKLPLAFSTFSIGATDFLVNGVMILDDIIFLTGIIQKTYWLQKQVNHLIVQKKFKALLASEIVNFIPETPRSGLGRTLTLTGYSSGLT